MNGWERISFAFRCFFSILFDATIPEDIAEHLSKSATPETEVTASHTPTVLRTERSESDSSGTYDRAVQMLALLQRDGRLIDFLSENISPYPDAQLGAAVRSIHDTCRQVLDQYVKLEPILDSDEDRPVSLDSSFDASAIKLIGNVVGKPPVRGVLRHKGWRVKEVNLPQLPPGAGRMIVAPAEVELS